MTMKHEADHLLDLSKLPLETLVTLSGSFVYALENDSGKLVQVFGSANALKHLGGILDEIKTSGEYKTMKEDLPHLVLRILETNPKDMKISISLWIKRYKSIGYTMYKDCSPIVLSLETRVETVDGKLCYCLYIAGRKSYRKLIGVFKKKRDLDAFKNANYKGDRISTVVVHSSARLRNR